MEQSVASKIDLETITKKAPMKQEVEMIDSLLKEIDERDVKDVVEGHSRSGRNMNVLDWSTVNSFYILIKECGEAIGISKKENPVLIIFTKI